jgi:cation diffusion facilitator CzcD-associated flavoprotein CzcO
MYAIIGAGPMGLAVARNLAKHNLAFTGYELHGNVGGLWDIDNPHSTMYESAHLISSKRMTEFAEFPMAASVAAYPRHDEMKRYFQAFARHFDLYRHYQFATRVLSVVPDGAGWRLTLEKEGVQSEQYYDGVLIASGTLHTPNRPELPGSFDGELMHACDYREAAAFDGKRVLIVGCGNSACDMAVDAVHRAQNVDISVRRGYYFVPKFIAGKPSDTIGGRLRLPRPLKQKLDAKLIRWVIGKPSDYGLPDPTYRMYESHPVVNSMVLDHLGHGDITPRGDVAKVSGGRVIFADGAAAEYDMILMATGYLLDYPFIDREHLNWEGDAPQLYLNVFHPQYDNLFMMGMVEATGLGWEARNEQAEMVALYLKQTGNGHPAVAELDRLRRNRAADRLDGGYAYLQVPRMAYYVHKESYRKAVVGHIRALRKSQ